MDEVKFLKYQAVSDDKFVGIITISANKIILKYKVAHGKNGGYYPNACSIKDGDVYQKAYMASDPMLQEDIDNCLKSNINRLFSEKASNSPSVRSKSSDMDEVPF